MVSERRARWIGGAVALGLALVLGTVDLPAFEGYGPGVVELRFAPDRAIADAIVRRFDDARVAIDVAIYSLTHPAIAEALARAQARGVAVRVLCDRLQASGRYSKDEWLEARGVEILREHESGLLHHKFAIVDERIVMTGSLNYTRSAVERHRENWIVLDAPEAVAAYRRAFDEAWAANAPPPPNRVPSTGSGSG